MPDAAPVPASTYRLQLQPGFGFAEAGAAARYLAGLGVSHVYLSPVLQAAPGSRHGYDVVDHSRLSAGLGGEAAFRAMVDRFRAHGLGVVVDVVPNHMALPEPEWLNRQLWSVLAEGPGSPFAHWFDVDWAAGGGRLLLPVLGGPPGSCLADLAVGPAGPDAPPGLARQEPVLRYFGHVFPLRPGTAGLPLPALLDAQHYRLADWRAAAASLNWRRFFDISTLIALRAEDPDVFAATHGLLLRLLGEGLIDGLRVDHPDGLADPRGYFRRLAAATGGAWVVAEKILTGGEELPPDWPCAGTTGYDALGMVDGLFTGPAGGTALTGLYTRLTGGPASFAPVAETARRQIATGPLAAEVARLGRLAAAAGEPALSGLSEAELRALLVALLAAFPVYRAYVVPGEPASPRAEAVLAGAAAAARHELPGHLHEPLAVLADLLLGRGGPAAGPAAGPSRAELIVRFQQTCGPVIAKGVEDTAFYRWSRLVSRNEVGWEPDRLAVSPAEFGTFAGRLARDWPATMTTLSTHDTKRQEDVRARLAVLTEIPEDWAREVAGWRQHAGRIAGPARPEPDTEYLLWQTLAGAWPIGPDRLRDYLLKAIREAKTRTSWTSPDAGYEDAVLRFARAVLADPELAGRIAAFVTRLGPAARVNSLGAKLVQLTMPGVPDTYQGCELPAYALVDPDNRRPADFAGPARLLAALDAGQPPADHGQEKLLVTSRVLRLRRAHPGWFAGSYRPLAAAGPAAGHALAFVRGGHAVTLATRLPAGLRQAGGWRDTVLTLPAGGRWRDVLTQAVHTGPEVPVAGLTGQLPVALLVPDQGENAGAQDGEAAWVS